MLALANKLSLNTRPIYRFVNEHSVDFDGVDDRIVTDGADTVIQNTTYSFWSKSSTTAFNPVFGHGNYNIGGFSFNYDNTRPLLYLENNSFRYWDDTSKQDDGEWHHWVVYLDTDITKTKLYCDGVLQTVSQTVSTGTPTAYTESLTIGATKVTGGSSFNGKIDEFAVYDRELTQTEITKIYNSGKPINLNLNAGAYQSANPLITSTKSMEFDGTDDYLTSGDVLDVTTNDFSISFWFRWETGVDDYSGIVSKKSGSWAGGVGYAIIFRGSTEKRIYTYLEDGSGSTTNFDTYVFDENKWYNITVVFDRSDKSHFYINGVQNSEIDISSVNGDLSNTEPFLIGKNGTAYFGGNITEVGLYDRALTSLEVASLYNQGMPTNLLVNRNDYQSGNPTVFNTKQVDFDGVDDTLILTDITFNAGNSIAMWINPSEVDNYRSFFGLGTTYSYVRMKNGTESTSIEGETDTNSDHWNITASGTIFEVGKWTYMVLVWNSDKTWTMYIDGVSRGTSSATTDDSMTIKYIGRGYSAENEFLGKMSQVGLWNTTLTADEVSSLYNHGLPIDLTTNQAAYESSSNLTGYWRMGSGTLDSYPLIADQTNATLGSELVTSWSNNDFSSFASSGSNITQMVSSGSGNNCYSITTITSGKTYKLQFTSSQAITCQIRISPNTSLTSATVVLSSLSSGLNEVYFTAPSSYAYIGFYAPNSFTDTQISSFTLKQINGNPAIMTNQTSSDIENGSPYANVVQNGTFDTDSDWTKGTGWSIANGLASCDGSQSSSSIFYQNLGSLSGKTINISFTLSNYSAGHLTTAFFGASGTLDQQVSANGDYSFDIYIESGHNGNSGFTANSSFVGSIDNVTLQEVNTGLQGYWKMGDGTNDEYPVIYDQVDTTTEAITVRTPSTQTYTENNVTRVNDDSANSVSFTSTTASSSYALGYMSNAGLLDTVGNFAVGIYKLSFTLSTNSTVFGNNMSMKWYNTGTTFTETTVTLGQNTIYGIINSANNNSHLSLSSSAIGQNVIISNITVDKLNGNGAMMTNMVEGNITNIHPLTKIRNYYRMGDGIMDGYPIIQDQTSPNLAHIPTTNIFIQNDISTWSGFGSYSSNTTTAPDGTTVSFVNMEDRRIFPSTTTTTSVNYTSSVYLKANKTADVKLRNAADSDTTISLTTEWKRYQLTAINGSNPSNVQLVDARFSSGMGASGLEIAFYGLQVEAQSQATAYLKTDGIAAVRKSSTTNLITYSEDFSQSSWTLHNNATITSSTEIAPDGSNTATLLNFTQQYSNIQTTSNPVTSGTATVSLYIKRISGNTTLYLRGTGNSAFYMDAITVTNEWQRYTATYSHDGTNDIGLVLQDRAASGFGSVLIWGAQLEEQTQAETYAKTTGLPVTIDLFTENNYGTMTNMSASDIVEDTP